MSPGYDRPVQEDFRRTIAAECLFCHDAYPSPAQNTSFDRAEPVFGDSIPRRNRLPAMPRPRQARTLKPPGLGTRRPKPFAALSLIPAGSLATGNLKAVSNVIWKQLAVRFPPSFRVMITGRLTTGQASLSAITSFISIMPPARAMTTASRLRIPLIACASRRASGRAK